MECNCIIGYMDRDIDTTGIIFLDKKTVIEFIPDMELFKKYNYCHRCGKKL